jgi:hypothetical protein
MQIIWRYIPDVLGILKDGAVRTELAHAGRGQNCHSVPESTIAESFINLILSLNI